MTSGREPHTDFGDQDDACGNCGGEGYVYDCFDGYCENAEDGCEDCARRCDWCNRPTKAQIEEGNALRQVLADALSKKDPAQ